MADCPFNSADENIADFIYRIGSQQQIIGNPADIPCMDYVNDEYNIIYTPLDTVTPISLARYSYYTVPGLFPSWTAPAWMPPAYLPPCCARPGKHGARDPHRYRGYRH